MEVLEAVGLRLDLDPLESEAWFSISRILEFWPCDDSYM